MKYSLENELTNIIKNINKADLRIGEIDIEFWTARGICCPACWSTEYANLLGKRTRRYERITIIKNKLSRSQ